MIRDTLKIALALTQLALCTSVEDVFVRRAKGPEVGRASSDVDEEAFVRREKKTKRSIVEADDSLDSVRRVGRHRTSSSVVAIESTGYVQTVKSPACATASTTHMYAAAGSAGWNGLDMSGGGRSVESSDSDCQARCASTTNCAFFTFWPGDGGCHLQDGSAVLRAFPSFAGSRTTYGPAACPLGGPKQAATVPMTGTASTWTGPCPKASSSSMYASAGSTGWGGLDMAGQGKSTESSAWACQARCASVANCGYFTFWSGDGGCHLQDSTAELRAYGPGCAGCQTEVGPRICPAPTPATPAPPPPPPGFQCACAATLYQHWAEGYPRDASDQQLSGTRNNCFGNAMIDHSTGFCAVGNKQTFTTLSETIFTTGFSRGLDASGDLGYHVSSIKVEGDFRCKVYAYNAVGCPDDALMGSPATPSTQVQNTSDRSYRPGTVTPGKNLRDVLGWGNDQTKCIKLMCKQEQLLMPPTEAPTTGAKDTPAPTTEAPTPAPTTPPTDTPAPTTDAPTPAPPTAPPTDFINMTRVCSVYDCPFWCLDGCHAHNKTYINSRAASALQQPKKTCASGVADLFRTHLCREPEAVACTYLSGHRDGANVAKVETAIKHSSEYANCKACKNGCK